MVFRVLCMPENYDVFSKCDHSNESPAAARLTLSPVRNNLMYGTETCQTEYFRYGVLRYLGYSAHIASLLCPFLKRQHIKYLNNAAVAYVAGDMTEKAIISYKNKRDVGKAILSAGDAFIWQLLSSVVLPRYAIRGVQYGSAVLFCQGSCTGSYTRFVPMVVGLLAIPIIIQPIDRTVDKVLNFVTQRSPTC